MNERVELGSVAHFSIGVADPGASAQWWVSHFDLEVFASSEKRILLGNDAVVFALFEGHLDSETFGHLAFRTRTMAALESARDALLASGVAVEDPGNEIGPVAEGSANMGLWFHDPDGYRWELFVRGQ